MRIGDWMQTWSGRKFYPLDPLAEDIHIADIAHALSVMCRFGGHTISFYSVAQHSVLASQIGEDRRWDLAALLHDAPEAYVGDMIRPLKRSMPIFCSVEAGVAECVEVRFGLTSGALSSPEVKRRDEILLATEHRDLMNPDLASEWAISWLTHPCLPEKIEPWGPGVAEERFMERFRQLTDQM